MCRPMQPKVAPLHLSLVMNLAAWLSGERACHVDSSAARRNAPVAAALRRSNVIVIACAPSPSPHGTRGLSPVPPRRGWPWCPCALARFFSFRPVSFRILIRITNALLVFLPHTCTIPCAFLFILSLLVLQSFFLIYLFPCLCLVVISSHCHHLSMELLLIHPHLYLSLPLFFSYYFQILFT